MQRSVLLSLAALLVTGAIFAGLYLAQSGTMVAHANPLEKDLSKVPSENIRSKFVDVPGPLSKDSSLQALPSGAPIASKAGSGQSSAGAATPSRKMIDIPHLREMMLKYQDGSIDRAYGRLFKQLGLSAQEVDYFKRLLADRETRRMDITLTAIDRKLTPTARQAKEVTNASKIATSTRASDAAIRQFLNHDGDYRVFQEWEDTKSERQQADQAAAIFAMAGRPISPEQRNQLVDLTVAVRKASRPASPAASPQEVKRPISEAQRTLQRLRAEADDQSILKQAAAFLTPAQLDTLKQSQEGWRLVQHPSPPVPAAPRK